MLLKLEIDYSDDLGTAEHQGYYLHVAEKFVHDADRTPRHSPLRPGSFNGGPKCSRKTR